ncbi:hypothetical protein [Roseovarius aestuariivivens]|uniref:hypothetical protein n=1 Tax=Roseovarius aestuariivivens TaxID=1888910 RepID=UPI001081EE26|nr:hypothetical protein [Roseovarius aestuariivivens]
MLGFSADERVSEDDREGVSHMPLTFDMTAEEWRAVKRADLVFEGVGHLGMSYEVRAFFNNRDAGPDTPRTAKEGYAGRFVVFGHGDCFGQEGHCVAESVVTRSRVESAVTQLAHPARPHRRILTVTEAFRRVMKRYRKGIHTVTLVTTLKAPRRADCVPRSGIFRASRVSIQVYT